MKFGLFGINTGVCSEPEAAVRVARAAEAAGFESVWTAEHVVLPDPQAPPSPAPPDAPFLDPAVALAFVAGQTTTIRLGTGIIILPQRNPVVLAKELTSVDRLSKGRLIFGLGAGYLKPEFQALGAPFADRGRRTDEYIEAILALWTQEKPEYKGEYVAFGGIQAQPRPVQKPHPPVVVGGMSPSGAAPRRALRQRLVRLRARPRRDPPRDRGSARGRAALRPRPEAGQARDHRHAAGPDRPRHRPRLRGAGRRSPGAAGPRPQRGRGDRGDRARRARARAPARGLRRQG